MKTSNLDITRLSSARRQLTLIHFQDFVHDDICYCSMDINNKFDSPLMRPTCIGRLAIMITPMKFNDDENGIVKVEPVKISLGLISPHDTFDGYFGSSSWNAIEEAIVDEQFNNRATMRVYLNDEREYGMGAQKMVHYSNAEFVHTYLMYSKYYCSGQGMKSKITMMIKDFITEKCKTKGGFDVDISIDDYNTIRLIEIGNAIGIQIGRRASSICDAIFYELENKLNEKKED